MFFLKEEMARHCKVAISTSFSSGFVSHKLSRLDEITFQSKFWLFLRDRQYSIRKHISHVDKKDFSYPHRTILSSFLCKNQIKANYDFVIVFHVRN